MKTPIRQSVILCAALGMASASAQMLPRHYQADYETASWQVENGDRSCELSQTVPGFGTVRFIQHWGQPMRFRVDVPTAVNGYDRVAIQTVPAPWQHDVTARDIGQLKVASAMQPLDLKGIAARQLLEELELGKFPQLALHDTDAQQDDLIVTVSAVRVRDALPDFQQCMAGILQLDFMPAGEFSVNFASNSSRLGYLARRELEGVVRRYKHNKGSINRIVVGGHTDRSGTARANEQMSLARARAVRDYLSRRGVPARKIEVRGYGDRWEINPSDPASNRRATVWLVESGR